MVLHPDSLWVFAGDSAGPVGSEADGGGRGKRAAAVRSGFCAVLRPGLGEGMAVCSAGAAAECSACSLRNGGDAVDCANDAVGRPWGCRAGGLSGGDPALWAGPGGDGNEGAGDVCTALGHRDFWGVLRMASDPAAARQRGREHLSHPFGDIPPQCAAVPGGLSAIDGRSAGGGVGAGRVGSRVSVRAADGSAEGRRHR